MSIYLVKNEENIEHVISERIPWMIQAVQTEMQLEEKNSWIRKSQRYKQKKKEKKKVDG